MDYFKCGLNRISKIEVASPFTIPSKRINDTCVSASIRKKLLFHFDRILDIKDFNLKSLNYLKTYRTNLHFCF